LNDWKALLRVDETAVLEVWQT